LVQKVSFRLTRDNISFAFEEDKYDLHGKSFVVSEKETMQASKRRRIQFICGFESLEITVLDKSHHSSSATTKNKPGIQYV